MKAFTLAVDRGIRALSIGAFGVSAACLLLIMVVGSVDALTTNVFLQPVPAALEFSETLLAIGIFLCFAFVTSQREHIAVDLLISRAPLKVQRASTFMALVLSGLVFGLMANEAWTLAMTSLKFDEYANAMIRFPIYPAKFLVAVGCGIASLECVRQLVWLLVGVDQVPVRPGAASQDIELL